MQNLHDPSGIGYADTLDPHVPLSVRVGPYVTIAEGDIIDLYCNGQIAANYTVKLDDLTPETPSFVVLQLDQKFISPTNINLHYNVTEPIGGLQNQSSQLSVNVKLTLPGGTDINPSTPWENEALALPAVYPAGIITSPERVTVELAAYVNMSVGDRVTLSWHGELIMKAIEHEDDLGKPIVIPVSKEIIERAGDSDMIEVRYEVRDLVNNWSRWSLATYVDVEAGQSALSAPVVPQAPNMELDLDRIHGNAVQALILSQPEIAIGDEITLVVSRSTAEGLPLEPYTDLKRVENTSSFIDFLIPNQQFQPITQGRALLKYIVNKPSGEALRSKSLPLKVIGSAMELALPRVPVVEMNNGVLDPTTNNVIVEVPPYYFMGSGNDVTLVWMGKNASGANVMHEEVKNLNNSDVGKSVSFLIPDQKVSALAGGTLEIYYNVTTFSRAFFKSPVLQLTVSDDSSVPLKAPTVDGVESGGVLDPSDIVLEAIVRIEPYAMSVGDKISLYWDGQGSSGTYSDSTTINSGTVGRQVVFRVNKTYVDANINNSVVVWYEVDRNNQKFVSEQLQFSVGNIVYPDIPDPTVKESDGYTLDPANTIDGATVVIDASAMLKIGDTLQVSWNGPKGSDQKEKVITPTEAGQTLEVVFASALVSVNDGQTVQVSYSVTRASGIVQESAVVALKVLSAVLELPAPTMDTVGPDGIVRPSLIPDSGATVRVNYPGMTEGDLVMVRWMGNTLESTPAQTVGTETTLTFSVSKAAILASEGSAAVVSYFVQRQGADRESEKLAVTVSSALVFDTSPVVLGGKVYLLPGNPDLLPTFPQGTTVKRMAEGGRPPYVYSSSDTKVVHVDTDGLVSVRGNGGASITATDAAGETKAYSVSVTGVIHCIGVGAGNLTQLSNAASNINAQIPSIQALIEIYNAYKGRWPMGNGLYWSSTVAKNVLGAKWYYAKDLATGKDFKYLHINAALGVAIR